MEKRQFLAFGFGFLVACGTETTEQKARDYECRLCGDQDALDAEMQRQADDAGCSVVPERLFETGNSCSVEGEIFTGSNYQFSGCEAAPACAKALEGQGGAGSTSDWEYQCSFCGDEAQADQVHEQGVEEAGCLMTTRSTNPVLDCAPGADPITIGFGECERVPECEP